MIDQKSSPVWEKGEIIKSLPDAVAKSMKSFIKNYEGFSEYLPDDILESTVDKNKEDQELSGELCVECGEILFAEGCCFVCKSCGFSKCG